MAEKWKNPAARWEDVHDGGHRVVVYWIPDPGGGLVTPSFGFIEAGESLHSAFGSVGSQSSNPKRMFDSPQDLMRAVVGSVEVIRMGDNTPVEQAFKAWLRFDEQTGAEIAQVLIEAIASAGWSLRQSCESSD